MQIQNDPRDNHQVRDIVYRAMSVPLARSVPPHLVLASNLGTDAAGVRRRVLQHTLGELMSASICVDPGAQLNGRIKSLASISGKMSYAGACRSQVLDIIGIRVIFQTARDCYRMLNRIHGEFEVLAQEYNDYIETPKPNGYQSIHTTVLSEGGFPVEIQLRTRRMHKLAERGSASHVLYKRSRVLWTPGPHLPPNSSVLNVAVAPAIQRFGHATDTGRTPELKHQVRASLDSNNWLSDQSRHLWSPQRFEPSDESPVRMG